MAEDRYSKAETLLTRSSAMFVRLLGRTYLVVASGIHNLGQLYTAQGRYTEAKPLYQQAFAILDKTPCPNNGALATLLSDL